VRGVREVSFTVARGEIFALLGSNGGKLNGAKTLMSTIDLPHRLAGDAGRVAGPCR